MPSDYWTEQRVATLTELWAAGYSSTRVGVLMGITRNAVIGKVCRLGLPTPKTKLPIIVDRTYTRQCANVTKANRNAYQRKYQAARREKKRKEALAVMTSRGAPKTSAEYRRHLPPVEMTKGELRAMLTQALQNTAAL